MHVTTAIVMPVVRQTRTQIKTAPPVVSVGQRVQTKAVRHRHRAAAAAILLTPPPPIVTDQNIGVAPAPFS